jgi:heat-inducible transcriptional repressor
LKNLIQTTAKVLSDFSTYTSIVLGPELVDSRLKHLQLLHLGEGKAVMIIITDSGHVEHRVIHLPTEIKNVEIERLVNILNEKLKGVPLYQLHAKLQHEVQSVLKEHVHHYEQIIRVLQETMKVDVPDQIFYGGKNNILSQPEFRNIDKVLSLLNVLEQKELVHQWLRSPVSGLQIKIGGENDLLAVKDCSVITTTYSIGGEHLGTVALLGPTRMAYPRVVSLMETISKSLSDILKERYL